MMHVTNMRYAHTRVKNQNRILRYLANCAKHDFFTGLTSRGCMCENGLLVKPDVTVEPEVFLEIEAAGQLDFTDRK